MNAGVDIWTKSTVIPFSCFNASKLQATSVTSYCEQTPQKVIYWALMRSLSPAFKYFWSIIFFPPVVWPYTHLQWHSGHVLLWSVQSVFFPSAYLTSHNLRWDVSSTHCHPVHFTASLRMYLNVWKSKCSVDSASQSWPWDSNAVEWKGVKYAGRVRRVISISFLREICCQVKV